jgi:hypothetical protein
MRRSLCADSHGLRPTRHVENRLLVSRDGGKRSCPIAVVEVFGLRHAEGHLAQRGEALVNGDEPGGVCIARLAEQHGIYDSEDRRIDADPDREVEDGNQRKARTSDCRPDRVAQVVTKMVCCSHVSVHRRS